MVKILTWVPSIRASFWNDNVWNEFLLGIFEGGAYINLYNVEYFQVYLNNITWRSR